MITRNTEFISVLGTPVRIFASYDHAVSTIKQRICSHQPTFCVAINPEKVYRSRSDPRLRQIIRSADLPICDGIGISWASLLLHRKFVPRCTGIDLFSRLIAVSAAEGWKVFLLGASPHANGTACRVLLSKYPKLRIVGSQDGFFTASSTVVQQINESEADLLFVAMGTPRQELWIAEHMPHLRPSFCMGIGGSLDVVSGTGKRAPALFRRTGTEWLFRLVSEPSRLKRQTVLPLFAAEVLSSLIALRK